MKTRDFIGILLEFMGFHDDLMGVWWWFKIICKSNLFKTGKCVAAKTER
jgi:hypothetical protein